MKAMVLAAGLGTRLRPLTDDRPKALVQIKGHPLLELVLKRLKKAGFEEVIINLHHHGQQIVDFLEAHHNFGLNIAFSWEDRLLDTGGAVKKARWFFKDCQSFLLHNVDVLTDLDYRQLFENLRQKKALACLAVRQRKTSRYLLFNEQMQLYGWKNDLTGEKRFVKPDVFNLTAYSFMGVHALSTEIFNYFPAKNIFSLIEFYLNVAEEGKKIVGFPAQDCRWLDVGKPQSLQQAHQLFKDWF